MATTKRVYERLAPVYDLDDVMFAGAKQHWRKKIIDILDIENAKLVLDITTGTGRAAKILSKRVKNGRVIAVDISKNMLKIARMRNHGGDNLHFILCDAAHLPLKDGVFDGVSCMCGMDTVDEPEVVLSEVVRVLKNKGRFGMMYFRESKGWLRHLDAILKKYYNLIWNTGNVDIASMISDHPLRTVKKQDLLIADALVVEKCRERDSNARSSDLSLFRQRQGAPPL